MKKITIAVRENQEVAVKVMKRRSLSVRLRRQRRYQRMTTNRMRMEM